MQRVERRVVVTGLGLVTPLGVGTQKTWEAAIAGKSGVGPITRFDAKDLPSRIAGEVKDFDPAQFMDKKEARRNDLFIQFGLAATELALRDAGLPTDQPLGERAGVIVGSGMGGLSTLEQTHLTAVEKGHRRVSPFFIPSIIVNLAGGQISALGIDPGERAEQLSPEQFGRLAEAAAQTQEGQLAHTPGAVIH